MAKLRRFIGIDISKESFDACFLSDDGKKESCHCKYDKSGVSSFIEGVKEEDVCVMESTGTYHLRLAVALSEAGKHVSVANPLSVSHFSKMRMNRAKTDSKDAATIAEYARMNENELHAFVPEADEYVEVRQLLALLDLLRKQDAQLAGQEEAVNHAHARSKTVMSTIRSQRLKIGKEMRAIEKEIEDIIDRHNHDDFERLRSIPGIGKKTAAVLIATTSNMDRFDNYRQVCSYFGLSPRTYDSGTSVHGRARICKMGMSRIRRLLYVCAWSAIRYNPDCKALYNRLVEAGKAKMVALIAVAHKLIKLAFALIKNKTTYNQNYLQKSLAF